MFPGHVLYINIAPWARAWALAKWLRALIHHQPGSVVLVILIDGGLFRPLRP